MSKMCAPPLQLSNLSFQLHDEAVTQLRSDFERQAREIELKYEKKMRTLRDELDLRRKTEIHEIEERKNGQINTLMKNHEKAFSDIKNYYNDITLNNLALINTLKVGGQAERSKATHCLIWFIMHLANISYNWNVL